MRILSSWSRALPPDDSMAVVPTGDGEPILPCLPLVDGPGRMLLVSDLAFNSGGVASRGSLIVFSVWVAVRTAIKGGVGGGVHHSGCRKALGVVSLNRDRADPPGRGGETTNGLRSCD